MSASPDWLYNRLTIRGPAAPVAAFLKAARGPGVVPWHLDAGVIEDDIFNRLVGPCTASGRLSAAGCRMFAAQFREKIEKRHEQMLWSASKACPFDLHVLLPVPAELLALGRDSPAARAWLMTHWGTEQVLKASLLPVLKEKLPTGHVSVRIGFISADWSPWKAIERLRIAWPLVSLELQPVYDF